MCKAVRTLICFTTVLIWMVGVGCCQSLGDVARQQRQNQQAKKDQAAPKVITNEDLPEHQAADDSEATNQSHESVPHAHSSKSADQWKAEIEAQKQTIATLQRQMDRLSATIHYVEANRYYNGAQHNLRQEQKEAEVGRMQDQMELQKKRLDEMQEAARKDGFGNAVYDP
jgi:hypothetical protein